MMQQLAPDDVLGFLAETSRPYALLCRSNAPGGSDVVELILGRFRSCQSIMDIPAGTRSLAVLPFSQAKERGFECKDVSRPILVLDQTSSLTFDRRKMIAAGSGTLPMAERMVFGANDSHYANLVETVIKEEIGKGECSNVVISRILRGRFALPAQSAALRLFCNLLAIESGFYWTFLVRTPGLTLVGATPEKHVSLKGDQMAMTAISGTARIAGTDDSSVFKFLADQKEQYELCMVVDEELKMLSRCCSSSLKVSGPFLRIMSKLVHTEYELRGRSSVSPASALLETMFAPTVVGSPLQNAFRVIARRESAPRSYYSGSIALLDPEGDHSLDSAITIRTCEITEDRIVAFRVGSTITRDSKGADEAEEARSKSAAFLAALDYRKIELEPTMRRFAPDDETENTKVFFQKVSEALEKQSQDLSRFWIQPKSGVRAIDRSLTDKSVVLVDFEDHFIHMWARILEELGARVSVLPHSASEIAEATTKADVFILGPGPGDPLALTERRQSRVLALLEQLMAASRPTLAVCLAHQILCWKLGLPVRRRTVPNQGLQRPISWRGRTELVGFYNTFEAHLGISEGSAGNCVKLADDGAIDSLIMSRLVSLQFHPESILTTNGDILIAESIQLLLESGTES